MKTSSPFNALYRLMVIAILCLFAPSVGYTAAPAPSCTIFVITPTEFAIVHDTDALRVREGDVVAFSWIGTGATEAVHNGRSGVPTIGVLADEVTETTVQTFTFRTGSAETTCEVTFLVATVQVDTESLVSERSAPTMIGDASGVDSLTLEVWDERGTELLYTRDEIPVRNGSWKAKIGTRLEDDAYTIRILTETDSGRELLQTETLRIGDAVEDAVPTRVAVEPIALLTGGLFKADTAIPISYLQIVNLGKTEASIEGFQVTQNGSADPEIVTAVTASEGGAVIGSTASSRSVFTKNSAFVPVSLTLAPEESRVVTLKAHIAPDIRSFLGTELKLDVTYIETDASLSARFPIRGTTWRPSL